MICAYVYVAVVYISWHFQPIPRLAGNNTLPPVRRHKTNAAYG